MDALTPVVRPRLPLAREVAGGRIRQDNEAAILRAAEHRCLPAAGFAGATMADIAVRAGVPKANLHYYFRTKQAVYRAVLAQHRWTLWLSAPTSSCRGRDSAGRARAATSAPRCGCRPAAPTPRAYSPTNCCTARRRSATSCASALRPLVRAKAGGDPMPGSTAGPMAEVDPTPSVLHHLGRDPDLCRFRIADLRRARRAASSGRRDYRARDRTSGRARCCAAAGWCRCRGCQAPDIASQRESL